MSLLKESKPVDQSTLQTMDESLRRCNAHPGFLDLFYENFLASSPKVKEKFANTDFAKQKRALQASLNLMLRVAEEGGKGPERYLKDLAQRHSRSELNIGAELYDLWLDSLLATVKELDPEYNKKVEEAWDEVMSVGIGYLLSHFQ